jgi:hypothetical protein
VGPHWPQVHLGNSFLHQWSDITLTATVPPAKKRRTNSLSPFHSSSQREN